MKISLNWLNEFVDLSGIDIKDIVSRYALTTAEIEGYEVKGANVKAIVGEIVTCEKIENSKKLSKLTVSDGKAVYPIVCGAPNVRAGMKVALDLTVGKATLAGCESHGMCLSGRELGISADHDGIIELGATARPGAPISEVIPDIRDTVLEIDNKSITNRPDLWGHYGVARELSVIFSRPLKPLAMADLTKFDNLPKVPVTIENKSDCLSYGAIRVDNITRAQLPISMQTRLFYLDIGLHGFLVDLSNYVMLETGQPNHAFAAAKIGKISIGNVPAGEKFMTLKEQEIKTAENMLFIKSNNTPVALAGIIGGKNSEIDAGTKDCIFEFATFDAACVRKTAASLSLRTDASTRFEKALDTNLNAIAAARTIHFIGKYDKTAKVVSNFNHVVSKQTKTIKLTVNKAYVEKFCGIRDMNLSIHDMNPVKAATNKFTWAAVTKKLAGLGFAPTATDKELHVTVPTWRATKDVTCPADVIEEIVRTYGYDNIVPQAPRVEVRPVKQLPMLKLVSNIKDVLSSKWACNEVHTYLWGSRCEPSQGGGAATSTPSHLRVVNSAVKGCDYIREELAPSLIQVAEKNKVSHGDINIFEVGQVYTRNGEEKHLAIVTSSSVAVQGSHGVGAYWVLAHMLRDLFGSKFKLGRATQKYLHPKNNAVVEVDGKAVGFIGIVPVADKREIAVAEVDLGAVNVLALAKQSAQPTKKYASESARGIVVRLSKYQKNTLDFTFETDKTYGEIESHFERFTHPLNMGFRLKDIYENNDKTSFTLQFTVGSYEKTLDAGSINDVWSKIIEFGRKNGLTLKE